MMSSTYLLDTYPLTAPDPHGANGNMLLPLPQWFCLTGLLFLMYTKRDLQQAFFTGHM